tara:strand:+ start:290 stop:466 length:177 start_codon:yes stop_codon:yes gene_type:complete
MFGKYSKAISGGLISGITSAITALVDNQINTTEWLTIILAVLVGAGVVYTVPNKSTTV